MAAAVAAAAPPRAPADSLAPPARRDWAERCYRQRLPGATPHPFNGPPMPASNGRGRAGREALRRLIGWTLCLSERAFPARKGPGPTYRREEGRGLAGGARAREVEERAARGGPGLAARLPEGRVSGTRGRRVFPGRLRDNQAQSGSGVSPL